MSPWDSPTPANSVSRPIVMTVINGEESGRIRATLSFNRATPERVGMTFHNPSGDVRWACSRLLLVQGLRVPASADGVTAAPEPDAPQVRLTLQGAGATSTLLAPSSLLQDFLDQTFESAPLYGAQPPTAQAPRAQAQVVESVRRIGPRVAGRDLELHDGNQRHPERHVLLIDRDAIIDVAKSGRHGATIKVKPSSRFGEPRWAWVSESPQQIHAMLGGTLGL